MKTLEKMTKNEKSLLLFLETKAVDARGRVDTNHMNDADMKIADRWNKVGFVGFGRIASEGITNKGSHWCKLSDAAWQLAAEERKARAVRLWTERTWLTTEEKRAT